MLHPLPKVITQTYTLRVVTWHLSEETYLKTQMEIKRETRDMKISIMRRRVGKISINKAKVITEDSNKLQET